MNKPQALTPEMIQKIANDIDRMPPKPSTVAEVVRWGEWMFAFAKDAQDRGLSPEEIEDEFRKMGYPLPNREHSAASGARPRRQRPSRASAPASTLDASL